ncbi:hypothetical protein [Pseudoduganella sp. UC29_71]|uniref:hypothetical protein n=1 Tax=Pseudoduganella sp. UC29_71 TaxID=3350174 RepID=UPI00366B4CAE
MEVRLNIDDAFLKDLQEQIGGGAKATDITRDALTIFKWAVEEAAAGRVVLSTNTSGADVHRLVMPTLQQVESRAKSPAKSSPSWRDLPGKLGKMGT